MFDLTVPPIAIVAEENVVGGAIGWSHTRLTTLNITLENDIVFGKTSRLNETRFFSIHGDKVLRL